MLGGSSGEIIRRHRNEITEIRMRIGQSVRVGCMDGSEAVGEVLTHAVMHAVVNYLMDNSLYSRESELRHGYFTTRQGFRVGVCGKVNAGKEGIDSLTNIASACIRIPREVCGCAEEVLRRIRENQRYSVLIASPPGLGKTTLLRDLVRSLSDSGLNIGLADERREIAACLEGVPQLDVGCRTDVMDGCPKSLALSMMIRACMPDMVAADEIGSCEDADALLDARRCGVSVLATVHGTGVSDVLCRKHIAVLMNEDVFDWIVLLGPKRGQVQQILSLHEGADERVQNVQGNTVGDHIACLHLRGTDALQPAQTQV